jgi:hypothetical protein
MDFSWLGNVHQLDPYQPNRHVHNLQKEYQHMWQKIAIDGKFSPNIIIVVADAVDDEDSAVHITEDTTVGTVANAPGLIPANPVTIPAPLDIPYQLLGRTRNGWRTWNTAFREFTTIADPRDIQLAINAYKATSNVCLHVDNMYDMSNPDQEKVGLVSSCHFRYRDAPPANRPFVRPVHFTDASPLQILDHYTLSTLPPGYGINTYNQIVTSQRPVLELPESSDLKVAMRMVNMTGPTSKMSIGDAFLQKLLMPEVCFHINAVLITEFEKFVAANGIHMAEVSFSAFTSHDSRFVQYTGLEPYILDRMRLLWECEFIRYSGKRTALDYTHRNERSLIQQPGTTLTALRRSHLPWFDRMGELKFIKQIARSWNSPFYTTILHNQTEKNLWSENEAIDTYIRRSIDPVDPYKNFIFNFTLTSPTGENTTLYLPIVTTYPARALRIAYCEFTSTEPISENFSGIQYAYWPDVLSDRYTPSYKGQINTVAAHIRSSLGNVCNPVSPKHALYTQHRNYGSDNISEVMADTSDGQMQLLVE